MTHDQILAHDLAILAEQAYDCSDLPTGGDDRTAAEIESDRAAIMAELAEWDAIDEAMRRDDPQAWRDMQEAEHDAFLRDLRRGA